VCAGAAITCWVALKTSTDSSVRAEFGIAFAASVLFSAYFGIRAVIEYSAAKRKLKEIKGEINSLP
jgi:hypothetical protein